MPAMHRAGLVGAVAATLLAMVPIAHAEVALRAPRGFFGVMWDRAALRGSADEQDAQWALMARSGVESVRVVFSWAAVQPAPEAPDDYSSTDLRVAAAARHGVALLPVVLYPPAWARRYPEREASPPAHASDYAAFVARLVQRYGPGGMFWAEHPELPERPVRAWQIWNEPNFDLYWYTPEQGGWAPEYVELLRQSKLAIKAVDPRARIVLAGFANASWRVLSTVYRAGAKGAFDVASVNIFTGRPRWVMAAASLNRRVLKRYHEPGKPIWVTETTFPAAKGLVPPPMATWKQRWYTTERGMASRLTELYARGVKNARRLRLQRIYWYTWASNYSNADDLFDYSGLIRLRPDGTAESQAALRAFRRSARR